MRYIESIEAHTTNLLGHLIWITETEFSDIGKRRIYRTSFQFESGKALPLNSVFKYVDGFTYQVAAFGGPVWVSEGALGADGILDRTAVETGTLNLGPKVYVTLEVVSALFNLGTPFVQCIGCDPTRKPKG